MRYRKRLSGAAGLVLRHANTEPRWNCDGSGNDDVAGSRSQIRRSAARKPDRRRTDSSANNWCRICRSGFSCDTVHTPPPGRAILLGEARLARMALEQDADSEPQLVRYRETIDLIDAMVRRLRLSWRLLEQDGADLIEIWLVRELGSIRQPGNSWAGPLHPCRPFVGRRCRTERSSAVEPLWRVGPHVPRSVPQQPVLRPKSADITGWAKARSMLYSASPIQPPPGRRLPDLAHAATAGKTRELGQRAADPRTWPSIGVYRKWSTGWVGRRFSTSRRSGRFATYPSKGLWRRAPGSQWHAGWERLAREMVEGLEESIDEGSGVVS
jgi:hypothetical protein